MFTQTVVQQVRSPDLEIAHLFASDVDRRGLKSSKQMGVWRWRKGAKFSEARCARFGDRTGLRFAAAGPARIAQQPATCCRCCWRRRACWPFFYMQTRLRRCTLASCFRRRSGGSAANHRCTAGSACATLQDAVHGAFRVKLGFLLSVQLEGRLRSVLNCRPPPPSSPKKSPAARFEGSFS